MSQALVQYSKSTDIIEIQNASNVYYSDIQSNLKKDCDQFTGVTCNYLQFNVDLGNLIILGADTTKLLPTQAQLQYLIDNVVTIQAAKTTRETTTTTTTGTTTTTTTTTGTTTGGNT